VTNPNQPGAYNDGLWTYDNVVFPSGVRVDSAGLLFAAGDYDYNLYSQAIIYYLSSFNPAGSYNPGEIVGGPALTSIPEAATWLMGLGLAALCVGGRRPRAGTVGRRSPKAEERAGGEGRAAGRRPFSAPSPKAWAACN